MPSRVEGLPDVTEVSICPDRLEAVSQDKQIVVKFADIAQWPRPRWFWRLLARFGKKPSWLPVADRDWFHPPTERFFRFYTKPALTIYMPADEPQEYNASNFWCIQEIMRQGRFHSFDLG